MKKQQVKGLSRKLSLIVATVALCAMLAGSGALFGCASTGSTQNQSITQENAPESITVQIEIDSSRASDLGHPDSMASENVALEPGATVYDALVATGLEIDNSKGYVSAIGGLAEMDAGPTSGWLFFVDGESPSQGADTLVLVGGENISWIYTADMGNDI